MADDTLPVLVEPEPAAEPEMTTAERLRAFEDRIFGEDHPRHAGAVEKGSGSPYSRMKAEQRAHHDALESLIEAEKAHTAASETMAAADARLEAAVKRVEATGEALGAE